MKKKEKKRKGCADANPKPTRNPNDPTENKKKNNFLNGSMDSFEPNLTRYIALEMTKNNLKCV